MRTRVLPVLFAFLACAAIAQAAGLNPAIVEPAIAISVSLANDTMTDVQAKAASIETEAAKLTPPAPKVVAAAKALHGAAKIAAARTAFGTLNEEIVKYMKTNKLTLDPSTRIAVCPMVDKPWLQKEAAIRNPYYGKEMLGCGSFEK